MQNIPKEIPFITSPEVAGAGFEKELEVERKVFRYKKLSEEALVVEDEIGGHMTYEAVVDSRVFKDAIQSLRVKSESEDEEVAGKAKEELQKLEEIRFIGERVKQNDPMDQKKDVLLKDDLRTLMESEFLGEKIMGRGTRFHKILAGCVWDEVSKKLKFEGGEKEVATRKQEAKRRTVGIVARLTAFRLRGKKLNDELSEFTDEDIKEIEAYGRSFVESETDIRGDRADEEWEEHKKTLSTEELREIIKEKHEGSPVGGIIRKVKSVKESLKTAKSSKSPEAVMSSSGISNKYGVEEAEVIDELSMAEESLNDLFESEGIGGGVSFRGEERFDELGNLVEKDFLAAYINYHGELKGLYRMLNKGKVVETAYVKEIIERAMPSLQKNPPGIVYLHGDFGTGKTAIAIHISRERFGHEPLIVSGSKFLEPSRFTEEFTVKQLKPEERLNKILKDFGFDEGSESTDPNSKEGKELHARMLSMRSEARDKMKSAVLNEKKKAGKPEAEVLTAQEESDIEKELGMAFDNPVQGRYILGAMYECMKEGKPLIIDEANAISPDVLIAFNDLMTKQIGEKIFIQGDGEPIEVKPGYCVMWTGNTGARYTKGRFNDVDPASYSRITPIRVQYLPNSRDLNTAGEDVGALDMSKLSEKLFASDEEMLAKVKESTDKAKNNQIFQVLLLKLLNKRMGSEVVSRADDPYSFIKDIYRLSMGARLIMDIFEGKDTVKAPPTLEKLKIATTKENLQAKLAKSNLTMRQLLDGIIGGYMSDGMSMDLEYYIHKFIQSYDQMPEEQAILYSIMNSVGFFQGGEGWPDLANMKDVKEFSEAISFDPTSPDKDERGKCKVKKYKKISQNGDSIPLLDAESGEYKMHYLSSMEMTQLVFGYLPARKKEDYERVRKVRMEAEGSEGQVEIITEINDKIREIADAFKEGKLYLEYGKLFGTGKFSERLSAIRAVEKSLGSTRGKRELFLVEAEKFYATMNEMYKEMLEKGGGGNEEAQKAVEGKIEELRRLIDEAK